MTRTWRIGTFVLLALVMVAVGALRGQETGPADEPVATSADAVQTPQDLFDGTDVHAAAGLSCASCHTEAAGGGAPSAIVRTAIAPMCAGCHSNAEYMQAQVAALAAAAAAAAGDDSSQAAAEPPEVEVNQYAQYQLSRHGEQMAAGETRVATCSDCHRPHGMQSVSDPEALVSPLRIADTCTTCHGDMDLMEQFDHWDNPPEDWQTSVHAEALLDGGDLSAPSCPTCHGAHNARRPATIQAIVEVCAGCHVRQADLYKASPHLAALEDMEEAGCITCHSNHAIEHPSEALLGMDEDAVCYVCHDDEMPGVDMITQSKTTLVGVNDAITRAQEVLDRAQVAGMLVDDGLLALREAVQHQILGRVAVHSFTLEPIVKEADLSLAKAAEAEEAGYAALAELQYRRRGLAVATLVILGFLVVLGITIRRLPPFS